MSNERPSREMWRNKGARFRPLGTYDSRAESARVALDAERDKERERMRLHVIDIFMPEAGRGLREFICTNTTQTSQPLTPETLRRALALDLHVHERRSRLLGELEEYGLDADQDDTYEEQGEPYTSLRSLQGEWDWANEVEPTHYRMTTGFSPL